MKTHTTRNRIGAALLIAAFAGTAFAADPNSTSNADESDVLRGPEVTQSTDADSTDTMTGKADRAKGERQNAQRGAELPMTAFVNAVRGLNRAAKDNPELQVTEDQMAQIKEIAEAHQAKMEAYLDEHRDELGPMYAERGNRQAPRDAQGERVRGGQAQGEQDGARRAPPPPPQGGEDGAEAPAPPEQPSMTREQIKELRAKRAEIMKNAPSDAGAKKQIFGILNADQRAAVKEQLAKIQETRARRASMAAGRSGNRERAQGKAAGTGQREMKNKQDAQSRQRKDDDD